MNIRKVRLEKGIGLNELARQIEIEPSYLSQLERGEKKNPSKNIMEKISNALDKSVQELFF
jgi:transcriptional regulator with XRE-family HTH domain